MLLLFYGMEALKHIDFQKEGVVIIIDASHINVKHAKCFNFSLIRMLANVYIVNHPEFMKPHVF